MEKSVISRPIIFSAPMVRAILEGRKTQTRRIIKSHYQAIEERDDGSLWPWREDCNNAADYWYPCPHGKPGDRLWVRETWLHREGGHVYDAAGGVMDSIDDEIIYRADKPNRKAVKWKPSIFMPRNLSRILLEITDVRVEQLQDIEGQVDFESDALKEGVNAIHHGDGDYYYSAFRNEPHPENWCDPAEAFQELWESINGAGSWDTNPWVWVIGFKRIEP